MIKFFANEIETKSKQNNEEQFEQKMNKRIKNEAAISSKLILITEQPTKPTKCVIEKEKVRKSN